MQTKVQAAASVTRAGEACVIANGREPEALVRIMRGEPLGTLFQPLPQRMAGRKRWIAFFDHPRGAVHVDGGAARALCQEGRSLLPIGVTAVQGSFGRGDPVRIMGPDGLEIGRGLVNLTAEEIRAVAGRRSGEVARALGGPAWAEVIHRDNLAVTG
jgi:glutamate 5-kinase